MTLEGFALIVPIGLALLGGIGWIVRRSLTGQKHVEDHESIERTVKLQKLLREEGMSLEEAVALRDDFRERKGGITKAEADAIVAKVAEAEERQKETIGVSDDKARPSQTTVGMGMKARAELNELEATLELAVLDFAEICTPARKKALLEAQAAWRVLRDKDAELASLLAEGGTLASLLHLSHQKALTEQRIREIRLAEADAHL